MPDMNGVWRGQAGGSGVKIYGLKSGNSGLQTGSVAAGAARMSITISGRRVPLTPGAVRRATQARE